MTVYPGNIPVIFWGTIVDCDDDGRQAVADGANAATLRHDREEHRRRWLTFWLQTTLGELSLGPHPTGVVSRSVTSQAPRRHGLQALSIGI